MQSDRHAEFISASLMEIDPEMNSGRQFYLSNIGRTLPKCN